MIEKLQKDIEVEKEILSTLPKNNKKNIAKYKDSVSEEIEKYQNKQKEVIDEMLRRKEEIANKLPKEEEKTIDTSLAKIVEEYHWFSKYNTSYEKMGFDKILYTMSKDKIGYDVVNKNIYNLLLKYQEAGVTLSINDFTYSPIFFEYMKVFFKNIKDLENKELSDKFEKLYWKESDIITHIELTFKSLYYKYQSAFDKYCLVKKQKLLKDFNNDIVKYYQDIKIKNDKNDINIATIYNMFINKELNPNDFTKEKIDQVIGTYMDVSTVNEDNFQDVVQNFIKLKHTLEEYSSILKFNYIIEDIKKLYEEKDKYKGVVKTKIGEIKKSEQKVTDFANKVYLLNKESQAKLGFMYKMTKAMWSSKNKKSKDSIIDKLNMDIDTQIMETKKLYDEYESDKFNERLLLFNDNSELVSILKLANSYYIYQDKLIDDEETNTSDTIREVTEFILNPYNTLINNINIGDNKDIKQVISDKYKLSNISIEPSSLEDTSSIENIINDINHILYYNEINKSNLTVDEILYVYNIDSILE